MEMVELWEAMRSHVLREVPALHTAVTEQLALNWENTPPRERAVLGVVAALDLDASSPAARRHARQLLRDIETTFAGVLREDDFPSLPDLGPAKSKALKTDAERLEAQTFNQSLKQQTGPLAALKWLESYTPSLKGRRAASFLFALGFPIVVPSQPKRRLLHRLGWADDARDSAESRRRLVQILDQLSGVCGTSLAEVELVTSAFCGEGAASNKSAMVCGPTPACDRCPLARLCDFGRFQERHNLGENADEAANRSLKQVLLKEDLPREKLARLGPEALTTAELLAILLRTGTAKKNALELATETLRQAGSLDRLGKQTVLELQRVSGLGEVRAITLKAALELARRVATAPQPETAVITNARKVFEVLRGFYLDKHKEVFIALTLNTKNKIIRQIQVSEGTLNQSLVHPREAFQEALRDSANAVIFAHNHPSGDPAPSKADRLLTRQLAEAGRILGIRVLDHVIVGRETFFSFADDPQSSELD